MKVHKPNLIGTGIVTDSVRANESEARITVAGIRLVAGDIITQPSVKDTNGFSVLSADFHQYSGRPDETHCWVRAVRERQAWIDVLWHEIFGWPEHPIPREGYSCAVKVDTRTPSRPRIFPNHRHGERANA